MRPTAMTYSLVDDAIRRWARQRSLALQTEYRDAEVRSLELVDMTGNRYQIWVDPPSADGQVVVSAWDFSETRKSWSGAASRVAELLDEAFRWVHVLIDLSSGSSSTS
jgi:hypothetical protein